MAKKSSSIEKSDKLTPLMKSILEATSISKSDNGPNKKGRISVELTDPFGAFTGTQEDIKKQDNEASGSSPLIKSVLNILNGPGDSIERLAFSSDPSQNNLYNSLYRIKLRLLPDEILKRIAIQDDLVAAICNARGNQISSFGRPQPDRFSTGFRIEPEPGHMEKLSAEEKKEFQAKIAKVELKLLTCGKDEGWKDQERLTFGQFLYMSARNACVFGRIATEAIYVIGTDGNKHFHSFRPIDAGTIFRAAPLKSAADAVRRNALHLLEQVKNKKLEPERYVNDEYAWVQVIQGRPSQVFTSEECLVHNFYPVTDVELDGYPLTPLDTIIAAVTTHINITNHNKLYFQSGRAARGMIVVKSDDIDDAIIRHIRQQFQASINSVANAWRMPIFGVGTDDDIGWFPIDNSSRDMEFQYLSDTNARVILSAFQMSPEELPGYAHLSRGTNSQALSEGNNEYKLEAARDVGLRPILAHLQNFVNQRLLPLLDPEISKVCSVKFVGLDSDTAEKESIRLQQDMAIHMTFDEVLEKVEKKGIGKAWGGKFPLNPQWGAAIDKYLTVGQIREHFFGIEGSSKDPKYDYLRDAFFFNQIQMLMGMQQAQQAQEQQQQAVMQGQPPPGAQQGEQPEGVPQQGQEDQQPQDLTRSLDQLSGLLTKSEAQMPTSKRKLLAQQRQFVRKALQALEYDSKDALKEIEGIVEKHLPKK